MIFDLSEWIIFLRTDIQECSSSSHPQSLHFIQCRKSASATKCAAPFGSCSYCCSDYLLLLYFKNFQTLWLEKSFWGHIIFCCKCNYCVSSFLFDCQLNFFYISWYEEATVAGLFKTNPFGNKFCHLTNMKVEEISCYHFSHLN